MEKQRLKEIDDRLMHLKHTLEGIVPIWIQVDRRKKTLELEIKVLEEKRIELSQGQIEFGFDLDF